MVKAEIFKKRRQPPLTGSPTGRQIYLYLHRPGFLRTAGADEVINNLYRSNKNYLNDVERKLMREARKRGAKIESMAASRPMCGRCQKGAKRMDIPRRVITAFKK